MITITEFTCEKIALILLATPGIAAPAAIATKPAMSANSMRSWPQVAPSLKETVCFMKANYQRGRFERIERVVQLRIQTARKVLELPSGPLYSATVRTFSGRRESGSAGPGTNLLIRRVPI
jgi:hypothetical protein